MSEAAIAARTTQVIGNRPSGVASVGVYFLEQMDDGGGRELHAYQVTEPDAATAKAQIHTRHGVIVLFELLDLHALAAVRTGNCGEWLGGGHLRRLPRLQGKNRDVRNTGDR